VSAWLVVGGGTAGCVVASRLTEAAANDVTVLEAGEARTAPLGPSFLDDRARPGATWPGDYPVGRGLGGTSAINGGVLSGELDALDETLLAAAPATAAELGPLDRALLAAAPDARPVLLARRDGRRVSTAECYLEPARSRGNLAVRTGVEVERVLWTGSRAVGVATSAGERITADRVVVCGGAIQSPAILVRSGVSVGDPGDGLADHPSGTIDVMLRGAGESTAAVIGAMLRRGDVEYLSMNRVDGARSHAAALLVALLAGARRGRVHLDRDGAAVASFEPLAAPLAAALAAALDAGRRLLESDACADVVASCAVAAGVGAHAHAASTCATGRVVGGDGAVRGRERLYVVDASTLPALPASGTYLPVVLHAERVVRRLLTPS
jgi:choline dehydrogenase-like flavoprotein